MPKQTSKPNTVASAPSAEAPITEAPKASAKYLEAIGASESRFCEIAAHSKFGLDFKAESIFAMQAIMKSDGAIKAAMANPNSVKLALINLASTGLTLNPANGFAYLIPRDGVICLDIGYRGLIKIATDAGSVLWARADVVYEKDEFIYHGPGREPSHTAKVFSKDRGEIIGAYCIAKTKDGDILTETMDRAEIDKIRGKSLTFAKYKSGPWVEWFVQMIKKAIIKRSSKTWPYTDQQQRMIDAIELANAGEGGYDIEGTATEVVSDEQAKHLGEMMERAGVTEAQLCEVYAIDKAADLPKKVYAEVGLMLLARAEKREARAREQQKEAAA